MDDKLFKVSIGNNETDYMYNKAFHKGHVQVPKVVTNCIMLSDSAKTVYNAILAHVFEQGQKVFPSIDRLALFCGCTPRKISAYINELAEKGFIVKERKGHCKVNEYTIVEVNQVPHLLMSDMIHKLLMYLHNKDKDAYPIKKLRDALQTIVRAMTRKKMNLGDIDLSVEAMQAFEEELLHVMKGGKPRLTFPRNKPKLPPNIEQPAQVATRGGRVDFDTFKPTDFVQYFYKKYIDTTGNNHAANRGKHLGIMKRVIEHAGNDGYKVKEYIDKFFEMGYDTPVLEMLNSARLGELDTYLATGKKPFYLTKKKNVVELVESEPTNTVSGEEKAEAAKKVQALFALYEERRD